jgi:hypothetical protein
MSRLEVMLGLRLMGRFCRHRRLGCLSHRHWGSLFCGSFRDQFLLVLVLWELAPRASPNLWLSIRGQR